jgi:hypothetical protein
MIITATLKLHETTNKVRRNFDVSRAFWETESYTKKFLQVPVGESKTIKSEKGIILVSDTAMDISGTITVQADKMLVLFCPIDIVVTNPDAESELDITAYFFD